MIPLTLVHPNPNNPRRELGDLRDLISSIKEHGLLTPIAIKRCQCKEIQGDHYCVLDGHRRRIALLAIRTEQHNLVLFDGEYKVYEGLTPEKEYIMMTEPNIRRKSYTPVETYEALLNQRKYGALKQAAVKEGVRYGTLRDLVSIMDRLDPAVREKVVWRKAKDDRNGITLREAGELAKVSPKYQKVLAEAGLSRSQIEAAVQRILQAPGVEEPEEVVKRVIDGVASTTMASKVSAAFLAGYLVAQNGSVCLADLVKLGCSERTAARAMKELRDCGIIYNGKLSAKMPAGLQQSLR
jgi:ParB/RepB/Spo0J family partition protein